MDESVTVIIPSNRGGDYLVEAIMSVHAQTVPPDQIILVDDGSPEPGLGALAQELGTEYVRLPAGGVSRARNRGAALARSRWLAFLLDDDVWYPDKLERQLASLRTAPDAIACYSDFAIIDQNGAVTSQIEAPVGSSDDLIQRGNGVPPINTLMVLRDEYVTIGGCDPALPRAQDVDLILRLLRRGPFVKAEGHLIGYRKHPGQVTSSGMRSQAAYLYVLRTLRSRAHHAGDQHFADLLDAHWRNTAPGIADWGAEQLLGRLRKGDWEASREALFWGVRNAGMLYPAALARAIGRRAPLRRRST